MSWRTPAAIFLGLLLPMPLLFLVGSSLGWGGRPVPSDADDITPVLSSEQQQRLLTFGRPCHGSEDCEPPLACLQDTRRVIEPRCVASECATDVQCEEGFACRVVSSLGKGRRVRVCVADRGLRKEGQVCSPLPITREEACEKGLLCQGWCGRPCLLEEATSCPQGFYCGRGPNGPSCLPTCEGQTCAEGLSCVRFKSGPSVCTQVKGENCQQAPCSEGQQCRTRYSPQSPDVVGMECVTPCDEGAASSCPAGTSCHHGACRRGCEPDTPGACEKGQTCAFEPFGKTWVCQLT